MKSSRTAAYAALAILAASTAAHPTPIYAQPTPAAPAPNLNPPAPAPAPAPPVVEEIPMPAPLYVAPPQPTAPQTSSSVSSLFPNSAPLPLDLAGDSVGVAQKTAAERGLQARILWIDGTANINSINSQDNIDNLTRQAKQAGFNTIVFDVKPIVGYTLYPSKYAQKLTTWKNMQLPMTFDPLAAMITSAHAQGLKLIVNIATFGEGHKLLAQGPGYTSNQNWQTVMYEATRTVTAPVIGAGALTIADTPNQLPVDQAQLAYYNDTGALNHASNKDGMVIVTDFIGRVVASVDMHSLGSVTVNAPPEGTVLVGTGAAGNALRNQFHVGDIVSFNSVPKYVPIAQAPEQKVTLFVNPNNPEVQQHELSIVQEIATNYEIDGMIFDDRLRFAAINADFSPLSQAMFEQYVGKKLTWPDDIFRINPYPNQEIIRGPYYQAWLVWRALTIRNWLAQARAVIKAIRPQATVSTYTGSWYGEYDLLGSNWASDDFSGPFEFLTPEYQKTGYAGLLDWMTTGCYYNLATIADGTSAGIPGATVEAAGQLSNRAVDDQSWVYAGLYVQNYNGQPDQFARCLQAAVASTQGIMLFDLSQINQYNYWPIISQAFNKPAVAPHDIPGLLDSVRAEHDRDKISGAPQPPVVVYGGVSGTGL